MCSSDEAWISNWFAFSHFHVALLLSSLAYVSYGKPKLEVSLSYIIASIILIYLAEGIFSVALLNPRLVYVQAIVFVLLLLSISYFTLQYEMSQPLIPLPRKLTTSSFDRRKKLAVSTIAVTVQFMGSVFRVIDMTLGEGKNGYTGDTTSPVYQNICSMALCDMMIVAVILGVTLRFFEPDQQKVILWAQVAALMVSQVMLAGGPGEMIQRGQASAGSIGTFLSILVGTLGAL